MGALIGGSAPNTRHVIKYSQLQVSTSQLDIPVTLFWGQRRISPNIIWYNNFQAHKQSAGKGGGKGQGFTYSAAVILALGEGAMAAPVNVWGPASTTTTTTLAALGFTFFSGTASQAVWSYLSTNYPTQALPYMDTAYVASPNLNLGQSASVPDYAFEIQRIPAGWTDTLTAPGWTNPTTHANTPGTDVSFADVIPDFLTNTQYGMGLAVGDISSTQFFRQYQDAQGLYFSPLLSAQEKATQILDRWAVVANTWIFWDGQQIRFVPLGDSVISGNGATYTPDLAPAYNLGLADFITGNGKENPPVEVTRVDPADASNRTVLEIADRTRGYVSSPVEYKDQQLVAQYGLRDNSSTQASEICNPAVGAICAQLIGKRAAYIRNTYKFRLSYKYILLLPGSIVTLTEPNIGLANFPVRIRSIDEDDNGVLSITAEELPAGIGTYFSQNTPPAIVGTNVNQNVDPGPVNTPAVCEPSSAFALGQSVALIAASGGTNWGACNVFLSLDGTDFSQIGTITAPALQGTLTASLATFPGSNPDTSDVLSVNATQSDGEFPSVGNVSAQNAATLCWVSPQPSSSGGNDVLSAAGELLAFGAVSLTGSFAANLTYLYRGLYGTSGIAHNTGDQFTLFDVTGNAGSTVKFPLPPSYIGKTLQLKFQSFNIFGQGVEDLSTVATYVYTPTGATFGSGGAGVPSTPTGFIDTPQSSQVLFAWSANPAKDNVTAYQVWRAVGAGSLFSSASMIFFGNALAFTDTNVNLVTGYTYFLVAVNAVGSSSPTAGLNITTGSFPNGQVLQSGTFSSTIEASIDFNAQVQACGMLEIFLWGVLCSNTGDAVEAKLRHNGADISGVTYAWAAQGNNGGGGGSAVSGSGSAINFSGATGGPNGGMLTLRLFKVSGLMQYQWSGLFSDGTTFENITGAVEVIGSLPTITGISFFPSTQHDILFSYAIRGFQAS